MLSLPALEEHVISDVDAGMPCPCIQEEIAIGHCREPCSVDRILRDLHGEFRGTGVEHMLETACPNRFELSLRIDDSSDRVREAGLFHRPVTAVCRGFLYVVATEGGTFLDFIVRGEVEV